MTVNCGERITSAPAWLLFAYPIHNIAANTPAKMWIAEKDGDIHQEFVTPHDWHGQGHDAVQQGITAPKQMRSKVPRKSQCALYHRQADLLGLILRLNVNGDRTVFDCALQRSFDTVTDIVSFGNVKVARDHQMEFDEGSAAGMARA